MNIRPLVVVVVVVAVVVVVVVVAAVVVVFCCLSSGAEPVIIFCYIGYQYLFNRNNRMVKVLTKLTKTQLQK